jgi:hypothetical protein
VVEKRDFPERIAGTQGTTANGLPVGQMDLDRDSPGNENIHFAARRTLVYQSPLPRQPDAPCQMGNPLQIVGRELGEKLDLFQ